MVVIPDLWNRTETRKWIVHILNKVVWIILKLNKELVTLNMHIVFQDINGWKSGVLPHLSNIRHWEEKSFTFCRSFEHAYLKMVAESVLTLLTNVKNAMFFLLLKCWPIYTKKLKQFNNYFLSSKARAYVTGFQNNNEWYWHSAETVLHL